MEERRFDYLHRRKTAIEKNKTGDRFCSECFQATMDPEGGFTTCCEGLGFSRSKGDALFMINAEINKEALLMAKERERKVRTDSKAAEKGASNEEAILLIWNGKETKHSSAKKARKYLRDHNHSVAEITKDGNTWYLKDL